jgi:histidyl-tRNA synthetase
MLGDEFPLYQFVYDVAEKNAQKRNFRKCFTSLIHDKNLYENSLGGESDIVQKEMIELKEEPFVLRPEGTSNLLHSLINNNTFFNVSFPLKLFYSGEMFRFEKPQLGRYRQFHQFGVEHFDTKFSVFDDLELIRLAESILLELNIRDQVQLKVNFLGQFEQRENFCKYLQEFYHDHKDRKDIVQLSEESQKKMHRNPLRALDSKEESDCEFFSTASKFILFFIT